MSERRDVGSGSIQERRRIDGRRVYQARVRLPHGRRRVIGTFDTKREAVRQMQAAQAEVRAGKLTVKTRQTVEVYLAQWLDLKEKEGRAYRTIERYRTIISHAVPAIGKLRLDAVEPADIRKLVANIHATSGARTAEQTRTMLHGAFEYAVLDDVIGRNPTDRVKSPKSQPKEQTVLNQGQALRLFSLSEGTIYHAAYVLLATAGLREGELLGLTWKDVDFERGEIRIQRQQQRRGREGFVLGDLKTRKSRRVVPLLVVAVRALEAHKEMQAQQRRRMGDGWMQTGRVIATERGTPMDAGNLRRRFYADLNRAKLPRVTIHSLRKTAASVMAGQGIPVSTVQAVLGHERSSTTLDIYTVVGSADLEIVRERLNASYAALGSRVNAGLKVSQLPV